MKNESTGVRHLLDSTWNSIKGLRAAFIHEAAFRQEVIMVTLLFSASFFISDSFIVWAILVFPLFLLLLVELLNSAIESVVDRIGSEFHELSGRAKDMGSAAVFINLSLIAVVWGGYLIDRYIIDWI